MIASMIFLKKIFFVVVVLLLFNNAVMYAGQEEQHALALVTQSSLTQEESEQLIAYLEKPFFDINACDQQGNNLLDYIVTNRELNFLAPYLERFLSEVQRKVARGMQRILFLCLRRKNYPYVEDAIVHFFREPFPNAFGYTLDIEGVRGITLLNRAIIHKNLEMMRWLLRCGIDPQGKDDYDLTPTYHASSINNEEMIALLKEYGQKLGKEHLDYLRPHESIMLLCQQIAQRVSDEEGVEGDQVCLVQ